MWWPWHHCTQQCTLGSDQTANTATIGWRGEKTQGWHHRLLKWLPVSVDANAAEGECWASCRGSSTRTEETPRTSWCTRTMEGRALAVCWRQCCAVVFPKRRTKPRIAVKITTTTAWRKNDLKTEVQHKALLSKMITMIRIKVFEFVQENPTYLTLNYVGLHVNMH